MASQIVEFFNANYELIYSTYKGSYNSVDNTLNGVTPDIGYSSVLKIWINLFNENYYGNKIFIEQDDFIVESGKIYRIQASNFCFILVAIDEDTVIYCGNYGKFDCRILNMTQARDLVRDYKFGNTRVISVFHRMTVGELDIQEDEKIDHVDVYPISRIPNLDTLLEVCFFSQEHEREDLYNYNGTKPEFTRIFSVSKNDANYNNLLRQYYVKWMSNFATLSEKVDSF